MSPLLVPGEAADVPLRGELRFGLELARLAADREFLRPEAPRQFATVPPYHIPGGGQINFADGGKLMGGGFYPMFNEAGTDGVGVAGGLACNYPKRRTGR